MLRALSTRRNHGGYERLGDESGMEPLDQKLKRVKSVPASLYGVSRKPEEASQARPTKKASKNSHPVFSFFDLRYKKRKATAKPEFARYMEYVKEGGVWDVGSNMPVIYYK